METSPYRLNGRRFRSVKLPSDMLFVMLHGIGSNCHDMFGLFPHFSQVFPTAEFFAPDAPHPHPPGFSWFDFATRSPEDLYKGVCEAAPYVNELIDALTEQHNIPDSRVVLGGFSQGAMTALHVALRRPKPLLAVLSYSGMLIAPSKLKADIRSKPHVCLIHGKQDAVVPYASLEDAAEDLRAVDVPFKALSNEALGHSIDVGGLKAGIEFIRWRINEQQAA